MEEGVASKLRGSMFQRQGEAVEIRMTLYVAGCLSSWC